mmetsp:Transcript_15980/g.23551  ORF Transcript_15980/g.23551 Transcript_15980/m.23551 type:complete len:206 (+) Transcript_15980:728-1345(+)
MAVDAVSSGMTIGTTGKTASMIALKIKMLITVKITGNIWNQSRCRRNVGLLNASWRTMTITSRMIKSTMVFTTTMSRTMSLTGMMVNTWQSMMTTKLVRIRQMMKTMMPSLHSCFDTLLVASILEVIMILMPMILMPMMSTMSMMMAWMMTRYRMTRTTNMNRVAITTSDRTVRKVEVPFSWVCLQIELAQSILTEVVAATCFIV